jgi:hypothetical protein
VVCCEDAGAKKSSVACVADDAPAAFQTVSTNDEGACAKKAGEGVDGNKRRVGQGAARLHVQSPGIPPIMMVCAACTLSSVSVCAHVHACPSVSERH